MPYFQDKQLQCHRCNSNTSLRKPERSLTSLLEDVSEIWKSAVFEMSLRRCMRRLRDAYEMHTCQLRIL